MSFLKKLIGGERRRENPPARTSSAAAAMSPADALDAPLLLDLDFWHSEIERLKPHYAAASPFPHILLEDFLGAEQVAQVLAEFPGPDDELNWRQFDRVCSDGGPVQDRKMGFGNVNMLGPALRELLWELNSGTFLRFLEKLTGIDGLIADPGLQGGGIHQVMPGGMLGVHADFTSHRRYQLDRRLNVLLYLNEDWPEAWGGELQLWSRDMQRCERRIRPLAGRCVIFTTSGDSWHGHPLPVACPEGETRKSIALYYYTQGREDVELDATYGTHWQQVPDVVLPEAE